MTTSLETLVLDARRRADEARAAAERAEQERIEEARQSAIEPFARELERALGAELVAALGGRLSVDESGWPFLAFEFRNCDFDLYHFTDKDAHVWELRSRRAEVRIPEQPYHAIPFADRLLLAIDRAAPATGVPVD